ncbi:hypothetical protein BO99DRAFT_324466 [Aspergillus violaceofuscus CBS 115571]|uniref:Uncharacterized protein n=1 Tax=Aspergillus violaceofuscus (strain CBS 115571) TaxID=1450538 RepID=A0A2V5HFU1_ASPV1|nr:hypothetical protein BO99DRAFT_324466 [Aspergillus violaceofuscus CBS 115571]
MSYDKEIAQYFCGYALINLIHLKFDSPLFGVRVFDPYNVKRLASIFKLDACVRTEPANFITAVIDEDVFLEAINQSKITIEQMRNKNQPPFLGLGDGQKVQCLYGRHRIEAAKECLVFGDRWWSVALYNDSMFKVILHSPGDIIRNVRYCEIHNMAEASFWQSKLPYRARIDMKHIRDNYPNILRVLDKLIYLPGLWVDIPFSLLRRIVEMKCPTETLRYLDQIYTIWSSFTKIPDLYIDTETVRLIQNRMPQLSEMDKVHINAQIQEERIFPSIHDAERRELLKQAIYRIPGRILTLCSMVQDMLIWNPCATALRRLIPKRPRDIRHEYLARFNGSQHRLIQFAENGMHSLQSKINDERYSEIAYAQLWLCALRHIENLTHTTLPQPRHKRNIEPEDSFQETRIESTQQLASLAIKLGFESNQIRSYSSKQTMLPSTQAFINGRLPEERYNITKGFTQSTSTDIVKLLRKVEEKAPSMIVPPLVEDGNVWGLKRCGLPFKESFYQNRQFLFIPYIYSPFTTDIAAPTTFSILKDMVRTFLGTEIILDTLFSSENPAPDLSPTSPISLMDHPSPPHGDEESDSNFMESMETGEIAQRSNHPAVERLLKPPEFADGFDITNFIAPLYREAIVRHSLGFMDMKRKWEASENTQLVVFYQFQFRKYYKVRYSDNEAKDELRDWIACNSSRDQYLLPVDGRNHLNVEQVIDTLGRYKLILVGELAHQADMMPSSSILQYISQLDQSLGKRKDNWPEEDNTRKDEKGKRRQRTADRVSIDTLDSIT